MQCQFTHLSTATTLLEIGPFRILTDPVFDPPGRFRFTFPTAATKTAVTQVPMDGIKPIDAVLLSHDQHADNLDVSGRRVLQWADKVITTRPGRKRLRKELCAEVVGLDDWQSETVTKVDETTKVEKTLKITATPACHFQYIGRPISGKVIGFIVEWPEQEHGALYLSGDTVWFRGLEEIGRRWVIRTALLHLGCVRFWITGPLRSTFNAKEAAKATKRLGIRHVIPIHYEGWSHFKQGRDDVQWVFRRKGLADRLQWLEPGKRTAVEI